MIIGILAAFMFIFGSGGLEFYLTNLKDPVKAAVQDKQRQEIVLHTSKTLAKDLKALQKDVQKQFEAYVKTHEDYDATPAEFDAITARLVAEQTQLSQLVLDARDTMHKQMTAEEWGAVFKKK
jgi:hypothetical protein